MIILFQIFNHGERHDLGKIEDGRVIEEIEDGFEEWIYFETSQPTTPDLDDEDELLRTYDGPHIIADVVDE